MLMLYLRQRPFGSLAEIRTDSSPGSSESDEFALQLDGDEGTAEELVAFVGLHIASDELGRVLD